MVQKSPTEPVTFLYAGRQITVSEFLEVIINTCAPRMLDGGEMMTRYCREAQKALAQEQKLNIETMELLAGNQDFNFEQEVEATTRGLEWLISKIARTNDELRALVVKLKKHGG